MLQIFKFAAARSYAVTKRSTLSCREICCLVRWTNIQRSRHRAARSGNAATLPTLQLASRQAGCATRPAFRHRKQAHERSARARSCHSSARAWRSACTKRSGAEQLASCSSGAGAAVTSLNGVAVATAKHRCTVETRPGCHAWSRCRFTGFCFDASRAILQSCRLHWAQHTHGSYNRAGGLRPRVVEGRQAYQPHVACISGGRTSEE